MPPRYAYWTILIDSKPTAFRATKQEELQPTLVQLQRTSANVVMKWFARGKLWENPEQAQWANRNLDGQSEKRGSTWRPGGTHEDPRARFDRKKRDKRDGPSTGGRARSANPREDTRPARKEPPASAPRNSSGSGDTPPPASTSRPPDRRPESSFKDTRGDRPRGQGFSKPFSSRPPDRPYSDRPQGRPDRQSFNPRAPKPFSARPPGAPAGRPPQQRPFSPPPQGRPYGDRPQGKPGGRPPARTDDDRPRNNSFGSRPPAPSFRERPQGAGSGDRKRPWTPGARPPKTGDRPWSAKPGPKGDARPWSGKPDARSETRPRSDKPATGPRSDARPWSGKPGPKGDARPWSAKPGAKSGARPWSAKPPGESRPDRPPFQRDARRPPKPFNNPPPGVEGGARKRNPSDDES
jgi:hypothetical protein